MEFSLSKLEVDAVLQLIQLSGGSAVDSGDFWMKYPAKEEEDEEFRESESSTETAFASSSQLNPDKCFYEEALPRRISKFGSILDIYRKTQPLIFKNRARCKIAKN